MSICTDSFNRPIHDLRLSVIDRCNFRCTYCMPEESYHQHYQFLEKEQWLTFAEILRVVKIFVSLGVKKVRITGGEPLLRPQLPQLIERLAQIREIEDLSLTTNGLLLAEQAAELKKVGLHRLTISLDSLDEEVFQQMNGNRGTVAQVLHGITKAEQSGFDSIKINTVIQKGVNDQTILNMVKYFRPTPHTLRFIEYMDVGNCNHWQSDQVMPNKDVYQLIQEYFPLRQVKPNYYGEVASRYTYLDGEGEVGFISSVTQPFCGTCTRARLSTDGHLFTCLFAHEGTDLRRVIRSNAPEEELRALIQGVWQKRNDKYSENRSLFRSLKKANPKIEMYQIGG